MEASGKMTDRDSNQKIANGNAKSMDEQTEDKNYDII
jgi:hypothetical protein